MRLKYSDCFFHFLEYNYRELNLNFLKLAHLLIDGDVESNPGPTQNDCNSPRGRPKKIRVFKRTAKKFDLSENINVNIPSYPEVQNVFFNTIQPLILNSIKPRSVTCPRTVESLQKNEI